MGTGSRLAAKIGGTHFQTDRLRQDRLFSAPESLPDGRLAERANGRGNPPATALFRASAISKRPSRRSANISCSSGVRTSSRGSWGGACRRPRASPKNSPTAMDRRSLREMRHLLFKIRAQYRAAHKRYAQDSRVSTPMPIEFPAHRPSAAKRTLNSFSARDSPSGLPTWTAARTRSMRTVPPSPSSISSPTRRRFPTRSEGCLISSSANSNPSAPMKATDLLIYILGIAGALAGYFLLQPPLSWAALGICAAFARVDAFCRGCHGQACPQVGW